MLNLMVISDRRQYVGWDMCYSDQGPKAITYLKREPMYPSRFYITWSISNSSLIILLAYIVENLFLYKKRYYLYF